MPTVTEGQKWTQRPARTRLDPPEPTVPGVKTEAKGPICLMCLSSNSAVTWHQCCDHSTQINSNQENIVLSTNSTASANQNRSERDQKSLLFIEVINFINSIDWKGLTMLTCPERSCCSGTQRHLPQRPANAGSTTGVCWWVGGPNLFVGPTLSKLEVRLGKGRKGKEKSRVGKGERKVCCKSRRQVFFRVRKKGVCSVSQGVLETCLSRGANYMFQNVAGEGIPHTAYPRNVSYLWIPVQKGIAKVVLNCIIYIYTVTC